MKIINFNVVPVEIPMVRSFRHAGGLSEAAKNVVFIIQTNEEIEGYGEAAPSSVWSYETQGSVSWCLDKHIGPALLGENPSEIEYVMEKVEKSIPGNYFAKAAADLALHDLLGKSLNLPVYSLLGGLYRKEIPAGVGLVGINTVDETVRQAVDWIRRGMRAIKLKVGLDPENDIEKVRRVREAVGENIEIRIDANQAYNVRTAIKTLKKMERYEISHAEQPVSGNDVDGMAKVAKSVDTPIVADESVQSLFDAFNILKKNAADIVNIKIMKVGGLLAATKLAAVAEAAGISCFEGSMNELGIGLAAKLHFASSSKVLRYESEIIPTNMRWKEDIIQRPPEFVQGCFMASSEPGLGIVLDTDKLERYGVSFPPSLRKKESEVSG